MLKLKIALLFFMSYYLDLMAQTPKNHGLPLKNIYIGIDNEIDLRDYPNPHELTIGAQDLSIYGKAPIFIVRALQPFSGNLKIMRNNQLVEDYPFKVVKINEPIVVAMTNKYGLLKAGEYPKEVIADIIGLKVVQNVPWFEFNFRGYTITIPSNGETFSKQIIGNKLNLANENAIAKLRVGDSVYFEELKIDSSESYKNEPSIRLVFKVK
jgi:hypothetical protein